MQSATTLHFYNEKSSLGRWIILPERTQPAFVCSKLKIETLEQGVKYV